MQTFVPHGTAFFKNAECLDNKRLGKQRVECLQIVNALTNPYAKGWVNHPATKMWRGYESALVVYGLAMCAVWKNKGFKDTCADKLIKISIDCNLSLAGAPLPKWLDDLEVMMSHRSNLIRKFPEHYGPMWPYVRDDMPYKWPV